MLLLIKLILAHLIGDFRLQPDSWVEAKKIKKLRAYQLYLHALIHGILIMLLVWDKNFIKWAAIIAGAHLVIDAAKILIQNEKTERTYFFIDQILHLLTIIIVWCLYTGLSIPNYYWNSPHKILLITAVYAITYPSSVIIRQLIDKWVPQTEETSVGIGQNPTIGNEEEISLKNAGKFIGMLERIMVFVFVVTGHWEAVGFLLAAKSVFRFGDMKDSKDRKVTEYILIGTLLSFGIAIMVGIAYHKMLPHILH